jgi:hypothetical protein
LTTLIFAGVENIDTDDDKKKKKNYKKDKKIFKKKLYGEAHIGQE